MDYTELKTMVYGYSKRPHLSSDIDMLTKLAELALVRDLPSRLLEKSYTFTTDTVNNVYPVPADFRTHQTLFKKPVTYVGMVQYVLPQDLRVLTVSSEPRYYTVDNEGIKFDCVPDAAYEYVLRYRFGLDLVSTTTNDVLTKHFDLYFAALMVEVGDFIRDTEFLSRWKERYFTILQAAILEHANELSEAIMFTEIDRSAGGVYADFLAGR